MNEDKRVADCGKFLVRVVFNIESESTMREYCSIAENTRYTISLILFIICYLFYNKLVIQILIRQKTMVV